MIETEDPWVDLGLWETLKISALGFLLAALISFGLFLIYLQTRPAALDNGKEQYHRGIYDICMYQISSPYDCNQFIESVLEKDWYGQDSPGWEWSR